jgi:NitT/TauT family transport system ATP-binding protein
MTATDISPPPGTDGPASVSVTGLSKQFSRGVTALDGIELTIGNGEFVSLLGPSGCGKSTLLRLIADLDTPTSGEVLVNGKSTRSAREDRDYGMVFQQAGLFEWRTAVRNVELPLKLMGVGKVERRARAMEILDLVQLREFADHYPWQLSGGMQQRVSIARALAFRPRLLLMDEPLGALDEMTRERMQIELMRLWRDTGITVVFVTHSVTEAVFLSTRIAVMSPRPGRIVDVIDIDLPQPRDASTRGTEAYFHQVSHARDVLHRVHADEVVT